MNCFRKKVIRQKLANISNLRFDQKQLFIFSTFLVPLDSLSSSISKAEELVYQQVGFSELL